MTYAELHCHSCFSFHEGASLIGELLERARELDYPALALTDHDNLCGAMEFAQAAQTAGIQPITGAEITLKDGSHLTLLAETRQGYANLSNLITYAHINQRREPRLDPHNFDNHTEGLILLTGCRQGRLSTLLQEGRHQESQALLAQYQDWFGAANVFVELQQNLVQGDIRRNRGLIDLARQAGVDVVATNNAHYHLPDRRRLQDALVAINHNKSLDETQRERRPNGHFYLKSAEEMSFLFKSCPQAISNIRRIVDRCGFDLVRDLNYRFPEYSVPEGYSPEGYLEELCCRAAERRYAGSGGVTRRVRQRLEEEFALIRKHNLAGFFLIYYEVIQIARDIMIELGLSDPEIPLEERPPGRGRGSSVAMLVGYLIGLSHIDPLQFNLSLERFLPSEMAAVPDIDLDFPRNIREELIERVHDRYGWDHAALSGMIGTYKMKGAIRDLGKALGLPRPDLDKLAKRVGSRRSGDLEYEMRGLPEFRGKLDAPGWRELIDLSAQLEGFPKYVGQHCGGMIISSTPLTDLVPVQPGAIPNRYICQWDKDSIDAAGFVKIDFLALGALSQMQDALHLIEGRTGEHIDLSRIDHEDPFVYQKLHQADTVGIFQVESAAQMQTITRIKPKNLTEMAYEVASVRPGVGANNGVNQFIQRHVYHEPWAFEHPLEERALGRTYGVILFQDQVNQLAMDVAGFTSVEADKLRRAFVFRRDSSLLNLHWDRFLNGALANGVPAEVAARIFKKFNGQYMFPESHAFAFGVTAYQMAWLKYYYPLEFFVAIFNQQPMGFYNLETLKEDAKRCGIPVLNPDINASDELCRIKDESLLLGFLNVRDVGAAAAADIVAARQYGGPFTSLAEVIQRTGLRREALEKLAVAGAFDALVPDRRTALWEIGLRYRPGTGQRTLPLPVEQDMAQLPLFSRWETMTGEYHTLGLYPSGHLMAFLRKYMPPHVLNSQRVLEYEEGAEVTVAGLVVRRQQPHAKAVFITLEDEFGHVSLVVWPTVYEQYRLALREPVLVMRGEVSRRDRTFNIITKQVEKLQVLQRDVPRAKDWQ